MTGHQFAVTITDVSPPSPVAGSVVDVTVAVENTGTDSGDDTITLGAMTAEGYAHGYGTKYGSASHLTVDAGETYTIPAGEIERYERVTVNGTLDVDGELELAGSLSEPTADETTVTVASGATETVTLSWSPPVPGAYALTASSADDSDTTNLTATEPNETLVKPPAATATTATPTPTVRISAEIHPPLTAVTSTSVSPKIRIGAEIHPAPATATTTTPVPTVRISAEVHPAPATATTTAPPPTVDTVTTVVVTPGLATTTTRTIPLRVRSGIAARLATPLASASTSSALPTVAGQQQPTVDPPPATATTATPLPTVIDAEFVAVSPPVVGTSSETHPADLDVTGIAIIAPELAGATSTTHAADAIGKQHPTVTPGLVGTATTTPLPTVRIGAEVHPTTVAATTSTPEPLISGQQQPTVTAGVAGATSTTHPATLHIDVRVIIPGPATATTQAPPVDPTARITATVTPPMTPTQSTTHGAEMLGQQQPTVTAGQIATTSSIVGPPAVTGIWNVTVAPDIVRAEAQTIRAFVDPLHVNVPTPVASSTTITAVPTVLERDHAGLGVPVVTTASTTLSPAHLEAVAPITTLPGAVDGKGVEAETSSQIAPQVSIDSEMVPDLMGGEPEPRSPSIPDRTSGSAETIATADSSAYTPERRVYIGDREINVDRDIRVSATEFGFATVDLTLYNLDAETWTRIDRNDRLRIDLGWRQTGVKTVFDGHVVIKRRRRQHRNRAFVIRGRDSTASIVTGRYSRSFNELSPHRIVTQLANDISGLKKGFISTRSERLDGTYTINSSRELGDWLGRLATKASRQTGNRWVWYIERGRLYFHPEKEPATDHVGFAFGKSVQRATPIGRVGAQSQQNYEVTMRCEPIIRRGLATSIAGGDEISDSKAFRVANYIHESKTTTGRHHTTAVLNPMFKEVDAL